MRYSEPSAATRGSETLPTTMPGGGLPATMLAIRLRRLAVMMKMFIRQWLALVGGGGGEA